MSGARILVIEDESLVAEEIAMRLRRLGHEASAITDNGEDAFAYARVVRPDMALVDIHIKGALSGIEVARRLRDEFDIPVVFLTAHADAATLKEATQTEPFGYIIKPFDTPALAATLETALRRRRAEQEMARMERWLVATMKSIGDAVIATDREFCVSFINLAAEKLTGWSGGTALGRPVAEVFRIKGRNIADVLYEATTEQFAIKQDECVLTSAHGQEIAIDETLAPIKDASSKVSGVVIVFRDATERRRHEQEMKLLNSSLEDKVRHRNAQLQAANNELASFSYSIAHDLRAPLRAIIGFANLAAQSEMNNLTAEGRRLLEVVTGRAGQMSNMIDDYLRLSALSHTALTYETLDMMHLANEAWASLTTSVAIPPQLMILSDLPAVEGDRAMLRQVWCNLLSNAMKFSRAANAPRVRIWGGEREGILEYFVEDNGIGFDPTHAAKLFRIFERLHSQTEFEGNGIGLCIVQRIVHRHEGDVSIDGTPGKGATVRFYLPRQPSLAVSPA
jgi:two-component system cell cycle sensor histidine kinase/response regulator CckA